MRSVVFACGLGFGALALPALAQTLGDVAAGQEVFENECAACHMIGPDAVHMVGPHLNFLFDRKAGAHAEFPYSRSLRRQGTDGLVWTLTTLDAYIRNPRALVSGTTMNYGGLPDDAARGDLMAFLRAYSHMPQNIPEASPTARQTLPEISDSVLALEGDVEYGAFLSSECTACHSRTGRDDGIPAIVGWPEEHFVIAMHAYRQELRPHEGMQMIARRLGDEEIAALAAYYGQLVRD